MKIVLLNPREPFDESILNALKNEHDVCCFQHTNPISIDALISSHSDADILIVTYVELTAQILSQFSQLKAIIATTTAIEYIDTEYTKEKNIAVFNNSNYTQSAVAEHLFAMMLAVARRIPKLNEQTKAGDFKQFDQMGFELCGKTLGILGMGTIGQRFAALSNGFDMKVQYYNRSLKNLAYPQVDLTTLLKSSDIVAVTLPLNSETKHLLNRETLSLMKDNSIIVSTSPDEIFDIDDFVAALKNNKFFGAGLDLHYPHESLYELDNVIITPTKAWFTEECMQRRTLSWFKTLNEFLTTAK